MRFLLFAGDDYYPSGGWGDFQRAAATLAELAPTPELPLEKDWWHVVDAETGQVVAADPASADWMKRLAAPLLASGTPGEGRGEL